MKTVLALLALTVSFAAHAAPVDQGPYADKCNLDGSISAIHATIIQQQLDLGRATTPDSTYDGFKFTTVWRNPGAADISVLFKMHNQRGDFDMLGQYSVDPKTCVPRYISSVAVDQNP